MGKAQKLQQRSCCDIDGNIQFNVTLICPQADEDTSVNNQITSSKRPGSELAGQVSLDLYNITEAVETIMTDDPTILKDRQTSPLFPLPGPWGQSSDRVIGFSYPVSGSSHRCTADRDPNTSDMTSECRVGSFSIRDRGSETNRLHSDS